MSNFATLKKSSNVLDRLNKELEKLNAPATKEKQEDTRFWQPEVDKSGNGVAVIRFLPAAAVDGDDALPWVRIWNHGFKGPSGKWYIENSLTTLNQKDPVSEYNTVLWNSTSDENSPARKQAREQKRKLTYISNILVVSDPKNPQNEGKVFLYRFGKKIFDKISILMNPEFEGDEAINPFDFWKGANFRLKIRMVEGYRNYDQSVFATPSTLSDDDAELEKIWKSEYSLKEFLEPKNFKSYDELKRKLEEVLELNSTPAVKNDNVRSMPPVATKSESPFVDDEDDEDLAAFKALAS
jgi:hypothetical protein